MTLGEKIKSAREYAGLTQEELGKKCGTTKQTIYKYETGKVTNIPLDRLEQIASIIGVSAASLMGWEKEPNETSIPAGFIPVPKMQRVPIIGTIACGDPITAEENIEGYADAPADRRIDFALICKGDSMIDAGINDGDIVYIRKQPKVENGQIAAVRIDNEATLKRVYFHGDTLILQPANTSYPPLSFSDAELENVIIEGLAVGFTHWM